MPTRKGIATHNATNGVVAEARLDRFFFGHGISMLPSDQERLSSAQLHDRWRSPTKHVAEVRLTDHLKSSAKAMKNIYRAVRKNPGRNLIYAGHIVRTAFRTGVYRDSRRVVTMLELLRGQVMLGKIEPHVLEEIFDSGQKYQRWLQEHTPDARDLSYVEKVVKDSAIRPLISIVLPIAHTSSHTDWLSECLQSVAEQRYGHWEVLLLSDASTDPEVVEIGEQCAEQDSRIQLVHSDKDLSRAELLNLGLSSVHGDFLTLLDPADQLTPDAFLECTRRLHTHPEADLIYSDEDRITPDGLRVQPFFKPDWSPDLFLSMFYTAHLALYRTEVARSCGGFTSESCGAEDYDLALRVAEKTEHILHVPRILYSWRIVERGQDPAAAAFVVESHCRAIQAALLRRGVAAGVEPGLRSGRWRVRYEIKDRPKVAVIIPTGGAMHHLRPGLRSFLDRTTYGNVEWVVVDNSVGEEVAQCVADLSSEFPDRTLRRIEYPRKPFNFSAIVNHAVSGTDAPYVVLLNDDTTVIAPDWIEAMLEHAQRSEVGIVGAKLLYPSGHVQHAGVVMGLYGMSGHFSSGHPPGYRGYYDFIDVIRNYSVVTFACAMMRRSVYLEVDGLDAVNLAVAFNDVDMCLRVRERGYLITYTPYALLHHHEWGSRMGYRVPGEREFMARRWGHVLTYDPYYNPNLKLESHGIDY